MNGNSSRPSTARMILVLPSRSLRSATVIWACAAMLKKAVRLSITARSSTGFMTWPIRHAEEAFGFARVGQTIVNVPDNKTIKLYVDDEPMLLSVADLEAYERTLDFRDGVLRRDIVWRTPG